MSDDKIFVRNKLTDFEKLLFAKEQIKELKEENSKTARLNGELQSEVDELRYNLDRLKKLPPEVKSRYCQLLVYQNAKTEIKRLREINTTHKKEIEKLKQELIQTQIKLHGQNAS